MIRFSEIVADKQQIREVPSPEFAKEYDVIVCGLGTSGSLAALFCAENGLSVLGIEAFTCIGGTHTAGGIKGHYFGVPADGTSKKIAMLRNFPSVTEPNKRKAESF